MRNNSTTNFIKQAVFGGIIGLINGFFGGGGGMVVVPVLENFYGYDNKSSHATSIAIILPVTIASAIIYIIGAKIDWVITGVCTAGVCVGGFIGSLLLKKAQNQVIGYLFCIIMLIAGIKMLFSHPYRGYIWNYSVFL